MKIEFPFVTRFFSAFLCAALVLANPGFASAAAATAASLPARADLSVLQLTNIAGMPSRMGLLPSGNIPALPTIFALPDLNPASASLLPAVKTADAASSADLLKDTAKIEPVHPDRTGEAGSLSSAEKIVSLDEPGTGLLNAAASIAKNTDRPESPRSRISAAMQRTISALFSRSVTEDLPETLPALSAQSHGNILRSAQTASADASANVPAPQADAALPHEKKSFLSQALPWAALTAAAALGLFASPWLIAHYSGVALASGWAANFIFFCFPMIQIVENYRNMRLLKKGGAEAQNAFERLAGVSAASQLTLVLGNMLNFPRFWLSGNPALIANALVGATGSVVIMTQLAMSGNMSFPKWLALAAGFAAAVALPMIFATPAPLIAFFDACTTLVFAAFTAPQILSNNKALNVLRDKGADSEEGRTALQNLRGLKPLYMLAGLAGNLLIAPVFMVSGRWNNFVVNLTGIVGPLIVLHQLVKAGLYPKKDWALLTVGSALFFAWMVAAAFFVPTGFWLSLL
ncbi:MAG: hypothetical protein WCU88_08520 [Elusimicrobiota bacterium]|jgi:hypothetical protein